MSYHADLVGNDLHISRSNGGTVDPIGVVTPTITDEFYWNRVLKSLWVSYGLTSADWSQVTGPIAIDPQKSVLAFINFVTSEPAGPLDGDRYINTTTGNSSITGQPMVVDRLYEWQSISWAEIVPTDGMSAFLESVKIQFLYTTILGVTTWYDFGMIPHTVISDEEYIRVYNETGGALGAFKLLSIVGDYVSDEIPSVNIVPAGSGVPVGFTTFSINDTTVAHVLKIGRVEITGFDTTLSSIGAPVYCDATGNPSLTRTQIEVGQVMTLNVNGVIYMNIGSGGVNRTEEGTVSGQMLYWDHPALEWKHTEITELIWDDTNKRLGMGTAVPDYKIHILPENDNKTIRIDTVDFDDMTAFSAITVNSRWAGDGVAETRIFQTYQEETLLHFRWYNWYTDTLMTDIYPGYVVLHNEAGQDAIELNCEEGIFISSPTGTDHHLAINGVVWFNQRNQSNLDFRIDGTDNYLFFADVSTNRIGIGTNVPDYKLEIIAPLNNKALRINAQDYDNMTDKYGALTITGEFAAGAIADTRFLQTLHEEHYLHLLWYNGYNDAVGTDISLGNIYLKSDVGASAIHIGHEDGILMGLGGTDHSLTINGVIHWNARNNAAMDFRIDGTSDYLLFADASENKIGIGTNAPGIYTLKVNGDFWAGSTDSWLSTASNVQHIGGTSGSWAFIEVTETNIEIDSNLGVFEVKNSAEISLAAADEILISCTAGDLRLRDDNLTLPVSLSDAANTALNTVNQTIVGSINEVAGGAGVGITAYSVIVDSGGGAHYATIQGAVAAHPNGTIFIRDGTYTGALALTAANNGLTLIGESRAGVIWTHNTTIITIGANTVDDIHISTMSFSTTGGDTISIGTGITNRWIITNVFADGNSATTRFIRTCGGTHKFWRITGCEFTGFTYAFTSLYGTLVTDFVISNNYFHDLNMAVDTFVMCKRLNLSFNTAYNTLCLLLANGGGNEGHSISYNTIEGGATGNGGIVCTTGTTYTTIMGNNIKVAAGRGIDLSFCSTIVVSGNVVYSSQKGLVANATVNCIYTNNMNINNSVANFEKIGANTGLISANNHEN